MQSIWQHSHHTFHHNYAQIFFFPSSYPFLPWEHSQQHSTSRAHSVWEFFKCIQWFWNFKSNPLNNSAHSDDRLVGLADKIIIEGERRRSESFGQSYRPMHACLCRLGQGRTVNIYTKWRKCNIGYQEAREQNIVVKRLNWMRAVNKMYGKRFSSMPAEQIE